METRMLRLAGAVVLIAAGLCAAQDRTQTPLSGATESAADKPATIARGQQDAEIDRVLGMLAGSFRAGGAGDKPALRLEAARVRVEGLDNAAYFEITREDSPLSPFRQGVFHVFRGQGALRLRVLDFRQGEQFMDAIAGLAAAPEAFPSIAVDSLVPNLDLHVAIDGERAHARTPHMFPTVTGGAVDMTSEIVLARDGLTLHDRGFDAAGKQVWGGDAPVAFSRQALPWFTRLELADGLIAIQARPAEDDSSKLAEGGEVAVHYTGWLSNGTRFDTTRQTGRDAFRLRVPGGVIKGWNEGLKGIGVGERRKLVIPPELGYADRGAGRGLIPPGATLIFELECMFVDNTPQAQQPAQMPPTGNPHGGH